MLRTLQIAVVVCLVGSSLAVGAGQSYLNAKVGPLFYLGDFDDLDTGGNFNLAMGVKPIEMLAFELESGYFWGEKNSLDAELWGVPLLVNAKLTLPVFFLEAYGGVGIGGFYLDTEVGGLEDDDWVFGGDAFVGVGFSLGPVAVGLEGKYYVTEDAKLYGADQKFEAIAAFVSGRLEF